jgi:hypothetical protein
LIELGLSRAARSLLAVLAVALTVTVLWLCRRAALNEIRRRPGAEPGISRVFERPTMVLPAPQSLAKHRIARRGPQASPDRAYCAESDRGMYSRRADRRWTRDLVDHDIQRHDKAS